MYIQMKSGRKIDNRKDEISDILLQLCALSEKLNIDKEQIVYNKYNYKTEEDTVINLIILCGQLTETIMEEEKYRHKKKRVGFISNRKFIIDRISRMFSIIFSNPDSQEYIDSFDDMICDAENFLIKF